LIKHLFVWARRADGAIHLVGELATTAPDRSSGRFESEFEYTRAWATESGAFTLDPRDDAYDVVGLEATCLNLARRAGLEVPESRLQTIGARRVLMVKRFDVSAQGGRYHMVSLRTLCKERPGIYVHTYSDLAQVLRKHSASPADDLAALYRRMVFNVAIGNVDDHLKNFWMLARPGGFRLAPAFDLVPDISGRGEHTLSFQQGLACPARAEMIALAAEWGVARAAGIVEDVVKATRAFTTTARRLKVRNPGSLQKVCADVRRRTGLLSALSGGP
jgi:serine/threonine-protein kinase HipA